MKNKTVLPSTKKISFVKAGNVWIHQVQFDSNIQLLAGHNIQDTQLVKLVSGASNQVEFNFDYSGFQSTPCGSPYPVEDYLSFKYENENLSILTTLKPTRVPPPNAIAPLNEASVAELGAVVLPVQRMSSIDDAAQHLAVDETFSALRELSFEIINGNDLKVFVKLQDRQCYPSIYYTFNYPVNYMTLYTQPMMGTHSHTFVIPNYASTGLLEHSYVLLAKPWDNSSNDYPNENNCLHKIGAVHF